MVLEIESCGDRVTAKALSRWAVGLVSSILRVQLIHDILVHLESMNALGLMIRSARLSSEAALIPGFLRIGARSSF